MEMFNWNNYQNLYYSRDRAIKLALNVAFLALSKDTGILVSDMLGDLTSPETLEDSHRGNKELLLT